MKKILTILMAIVLMSVTAVAVSATFEITANISPALEEYDAVGNGQDITFTLTYDEPENVTTIAVEFNYNSDKLLIANWEDYTVIESIDEKSKDPVLPIATTISRKDYEYEVSACLWKTVDEITNFGKFTLSRSDATKLSSVYAEGVDLCLVAFQLAEGLTVEDIDEDDFVITKVFVADSKESGLAEFGYNYPELGNNSNAIAVVNNVIYAAPSALTVPVAAGDVVYEGDKDPVTVAQTGNYELAIDSGYVVVNTGVTAQKVYKVEDGAVSEVEELENAVLSTDISEASVRSDIESKTGLKFIANFSAAAADIYTEAGFIATAETAIVGDDYELNMALVEANKANAGKITEFVSNAVVDVSRAVITGIPLTKSGVETEIACRPYVKLADGTVIYGEVMKTTLYDVALAIKEAADQSEYEENKTYVDEIIDAQENEVIIPSEPVLP